MTTMFEGKYEFTTMSLYGKPIEVMQENFKRGLPKYYYHSDEDNCDCPLTLEVFTDDIDYVIHDDGDPVYHHSIDDGIANDSRLTAILFDHADKINKDRYLDDGSAYVAIVIKNFGEDKKFVPATKFCFNFRTLDDAVNFARDCQKRIGGKYLQDIETRQYGYDPVDLTLEIIDRPTEDGKSQFFASNGKRIKAREARAMIESGQAMLVDEFTSTKLERAKWNLINRYETAGEARDAIERRIRSYLKCNNIQVSINEDYIAEFGDDYDPFDVSAKDLDGNYLFPSVRKILIDDMFDRRDEILACKYLYSVDEFASNLRYQIDRAFDADKARIESMLESQNDNATEENEMTNENQTMAIETASNETQTADNANQTPSAELENQTRDNANQTTQATQIVSDPQIPSEGSLDSIPSDSNAGLSVTPRKIFKVKFTEVRDPFYYICEKGNSVNWTDWKVEKISASDARRMKRAGEAIIVEDTVIPQIVDEYIDFIRENFEHDAQIDEVDEWKFCFGMNLTDTFYCRKNAAGRFDSNFQHTCMAIQMNSSIKHAIDRVIMEIDDDADLEKWLWRFKVTFSDAREKDLEEIYEEAYEDAADRFVEFEEELASNALAYAYDYVELFNAHSKQKILDGAMDFFDEYFPVTRGECDYYYAHRFEDLHSKGSSESEYAESLEDFKSEIKEFFDAECYIWDLLNGFATRGILVKKFEGNATRRNEKEPSNEETLDSPASKSLADMTQTSYSDSQEKSSSTLEERIATIIATITEEQIKAINATRRELIETQNIIAPAIEEITDSIVALKKENADLRAEIQSLKSAVAILQNANAASTSDSPEFLQAFARENYATYKTRVEEYRIQVVRKARQELQARDLGTSDEDIEKYFPNTTFQFNQLIDFEIEMAIRRKSTEQEMLDFFESEGKSSIKREFEIDLENLSNDNPPTGDPDRDPQKPSEDSSVESTSEIIAGQKGGVAPVDSGSVTDTVETESESSASVESKDSAIETESDIYAGEIRCTVTKKDLKEGIDSAFRYLPTKTDQEFERQFRLSKTHETCLEIQAQDHKKHGFVCYIPANFEGDFDIAIDAKQFKEIVKNAPDEIIRIRELEGKIEIRSGAMNSYLTTGDPNYYPNIDELDGDVEFKIDSEEFARMIRKTSFATKKDDSRPIFTACALHIDGNKATMQATDTHRLAIAGGDIENENAGIFNFLIPATTLENMLTEDTFKRAVHTDITIRANKKQIQLQFDNVYIVANLIKGSFPDLANVIPDSIQTKFRIKRQNLLNTIKRIPKQTKKLEIVTVLEIMHGEIHVDTSKRGTQIAFEILPIKLDGEEVKIAIDPTFLKDALAAMKSEFIDIEIAGELKPIQIHDLDDERYQFICTPMKINR